MKKYLGAFLAFLMALSLAACAGPAPAESAPQAPAPAESMPEESPSPETMPAQQPQQQEGEMPMHISVTASGSTVVFELNDSQAARGLYEQLPMTVAVENFSNNEKIFYPPEELDTSDAPLAEGGAGTLAYYEPWGDVVMFYGSFDANGSLFARGKAVSGAEQIANLTGTVEIDVYE